jgi:hypothetical protein
LMPQQDSLEWKAFSFKPSTLRYRDSNWFSLCWGYNTTDEGFSSYGSHQRWYKDLEDSGAYPCVLFDSDDEQEIGVLRWSGQHMDRQRIIEEFHKFSEKVHRRERNDVFKKYSFGLKLNSYKCFEEPRTDPLRPNWHGIFRPAPDKAYGVYCDRKQSQDVKRLLLKGFNRIVNSNFRIGMYDITFLPSVEIASEGHSPSVSEINRRVKLQVTHTAVLLDLKLFESECIYQLDTPIKFHTGPQVPMPYHLWHHPGDPEVIYPDEPPEEDVPQVLTLRQVLMGLPYPLPFGPTPGQQDENGAMHTTNSADRLFYSVDRVPKSFTDKNTFIVRCAVVEDRYELARSFMATLPGFILTFYGEVAFQAWIKGSIASTGANLSHFGMSQGMWDGSWTSADDEQMKNDCALPMSRKVIMKMEGMSLVAQGLSTTNPFERPVKNNTGNLTLGDFTTASNRASKRRMPNEEIAATAPDNRKRPPGFPDTTTPTSLHQHRLDGTLPSITTNGKVSSTAEDNTGSDVPNAEGNQAQMDISTDSSRAPTAEGDKTIGGNTYDLSLAPTAEGDRLLDETMSLDDSLAPTAEGDRTTVGRLDDGSVRTSASELDTSSKTATANNTGIFLVLGANQSRQAKDTSLVYSEGGTEKSFDLDKELNEIRRSTSDDEDSDESSISTQTTTNRGKSPNSDTEDPRSPFRFEEKTRSPSPVSIHNSDVDSVNGESETKAAFVYTPSEDPGVIQPQAMPKESAKLGDTTANFGLRPPSPSTSSPSNSVRSARRNEHVPTKVTKTVKHPIRSNLEKPPPRSKPEATNPGITPRERTASQEASARSNDK